MERYIVHGHAEHEETGECHRLAGDTMGYSVHYKAAFYRQHEEWMKKEAELKQVIADNQKVAREWKERAEKSRGIDRDFEKVF